ncbi:uncharacterized protein B0T23DRAFT_406177 [Neurospora hispaniola]|uniref:Uncharacterized protein n=1 Tax=Neurospora hispaniola TaxID=588809 RepID=A0AAJ0I3H6_9PEZI|nr:hypothetical protein B0T23DRAFT_406177 [Neurospora hispaniola]
MLLIGEDLVTPEKSIVMNKLAKVTMPTFVPRGTTSRKSYLPPSAKTLFSSSTEASYPSVRRSRYSTSRVKIYLGGRSG